jgi:hypothetical protein
MLQVGLTVGLYLAGLVFAAGGAWVALKESQRHVNGLGAKLAKLEEQRNERHNRVCMALVALSGTEVDRRAVISCLLGEKTSC